MKSFYLLYQAIYVYINPGEIKTVIAIWWPLSMNNLSTTS